MEKTTLETGTVGQAMVETLFQTEEERGCLSHQDHHLEDNTGREWVIIVSFIIQVFGIILMGMRMSIQGIKELWVKGDREVFLEGDSQEAREDSLEVILSISHTWVVAEGSLTRVSMEGGEVIMWAMMVREAGVEEEEVQGDNLWVRVI